MGIQALQAMNHNTGFLLNQMWGLDCYGRFSQDSLTPHFAKGVQLWVSLIPLNSERV